MLAAVEMVEDAVGVASLLAEAASVPRFHVLAEAVGDELLQSQLSSSTQNLLKYLECEGA